MNNWNKFEDFEKFQWIYGQTISESVTYFDLKFRKLKKTQTHIKLLSEILALKGSKKQT